ncbi:DsbA family oxidoreductase [Thioalkalivibrio sp. HK1]|uniref:DsbA family oxidoreductase n=1 Tax=Thioalkalivibrio sp. HK1 TaxID=1469245 RepID=UPI0004B8C11F|nr:DsbA family oxidoreductase [Thioalkalivibrio sp. HK1]
MNEQRSIRIDIFSDTICPWCWIGKRRLERALKERPDLQVETIWHAFQLNPQMPSEGMDRQDYLATKFGGEENARSIYGRIMTQGAREALPFDFKSIARTPNTVDSHRLVRWASEQPQGQEPMVEALFEAYFAKGRDIGDLDTLVQIALDAGYDGIEARRMLQSDALRDAIVGEDSQARNAGISGVPCFVLDGKVAVPGAVEPEDFLRIFQQYGIGENEAVTAPAAGGGAG